MGELGKDAEIEVKIEGLAFGGRGIAKHQGMVIFVTDAIPGDIARVRIQRLKSNYAESSLVDLLQPSPLRVEPRCSLHHQCGGCVWQALPYDKQLIFKESIVKSTLEHLGKQNKFQLLPIIASPAIWHYRNKMEFAFGRDSAGELVLGLHSPGNFARVVDIQECFLHPPEFNTVLKVVREFVRERQLEPYEPTTHRGLLRHLVIRHSHGTKKLLVVLITARAEPAELKLLPTIIKRQVPNLNGFIWGVSTRVADVAQIESVVFSDGEGFLLEQLAGLKFQVSAFSFFQTNTPGAERLYSVVKDFVELTGREVLIDAYCGTGTIGIFCADRAQRVYGIELLPQAVWDARRNARLNNYTHCVFLVGDIPRTVPLLNQILKQPVTRIVVDPPRSGLDKKSVRALLSLQAEVIVYVSCNPTTLARDLQFFTDAGYELIKVQPVDLFPHTYHIETVAQLKKPKL